MKKVKDLRIPDDYMFGRVMENDSLCKDVLECLLGHPVGELHRIDSQHEIRGSYQGKTIRLDIYTEDDVAMYDAEMQNLNHRSVEKLELPKRLRIYQALMDTDYMKRNNTYYGLPDGIIVFICTFDPFGEGKYKYTFQNTCNEVAGLILNDRTEKYFINCAADGVQGVEHEDDVSEDFKVLCHYIMTGEIGNDLTRRLELEVERVRQNEEGGTRMKELFWEEDIRLDAIEEGREIGIEQGIEQGKCLERENTERAIAAAKREKRRADALEEEVLALKKLLAQN